MFLMRKSRRFTGSATGDNTVGSIFDMKLHQFFYSFFINFPAFCKWGDHSYERSFKHFYFLLYFRISYRVSREDNQFSILIYYKGVYNTPLLATRNSHLVPSFSLYAILD